jgi:hypothetical protein
MQAVIIARFLGPTDLVLQAQSNGSRICDGGRFTPPSKHSPTLCAINYDVMFSVVHPLLYQRLNFGSEFSSGLVLVPALRHISAMQFEAAFPRLWELQELIDR